MRELVEHMARTLVENPDGVSVEETTQEDMTVYELRVEEADLGRVIGKEGRIAKAMRMIVRSAAARQGQKATIEIMD
ncbi:MAG: KH domain-containing protein [Candidatus Fermentibacteria bacterium]|nr:KH domain-containing protein [Candidatus Sabulitectum sp.]MEA3266058.1 KH domain-containing protein [Candidatus Fermentibacteria bacterium]